MSRKAVKTSTSTDVKSELPRNLLKDAVAAGNLAEIKRVLTEHKELIVDSVNEIIKLTSEQIRDVVQSIVPNTAHAGLDIDHAIFEIAIRSKDIPTIKFIKERDIQQCKIQDTEDILKTAIDSTDFKFLGKLHNIGYNLNMWANLHEMVLYSAENGCLKFIKVADEDCEFDQEFLSKTLILAAINGHLNIVKYCCNQGADLFADNCSALRNAELHSNDAVVQFLKSEMNQPYAIANMQRQQTQKNHEVIVEMLQHLTNHIEEINGSVGETSNTVSDIKTELTSFREAYDDVHQ